MTERQPSQIQPPKLLRPSGGYHNLRSFQVATLIYDSTVCFCNRFVDKRSRTHDQMVQAARSGRQNIAEGSRASATSSQTELRLVNVARASLDELLLDYEDYLRQNGHRQWNKDDPEAREVRQMGKIRPPDKAELSGYGQATDRSKHSGQPDQSDPTDPSDIFGPYARWINSPNPATIANAILCLIHQANYLLDQQIAGLERQFVQEGGYSERLATARIQERRRQDNKNRTDQSDRTNRTDEARSEPPFCPTCPVCGNIMALRTAHKGPHAGSQFWGCSGYPECRGTRTLEGLAHPKNR